MWDLRAGRTGTNIVKSTGIVWIKINQEMTPEEFKDVFFDRTESDKSIPDTNEFHRGTILLK